MQKISSKLISLYRLTPNLGVNSSPSDCTCVAENSVDQGNNLLQKNLLFSWHVKLLNINILGDYNKAN